MHIYIYMYEHYLGLSFVDDDVSYVVLARGRVPHRDLPTDAGMHQCQNRPSI
jgi:hypothetical protein